MSAPTWSPTDEDTADLLTVLADDGTLHTDDEWHTFCMALTQACDQSGRIEPNRLRPLLRGAVKPCRVGAFTRRALLSGLIAYTGEYQVSDDTGSRNGGKPARVMRLLT